MEIKVGQIWGDDDCIYHIMGVCGSDGCCVITNKRRNSFSIEWISDFTELRYIGESCVAIEDLFNVKEQSK